jgi:5'-3' exonuclease
VGRVLVPDLCFGVCAVILLVDGSWLACASWWANPADVPGRFASTVSRLSDQFGSGTPTAAWDAPGGSWRSELFPAYKAGRTAKPDALVHALAACRKLPGMRHVEVPGYEADDILATLAADSWDEVLVLTADKDLAQIVTDRVKLVDPRENVTGPAEVEARWGVPPAKVRLLLSWMGDSSDGLPGVKGVGPKRAIPRALAGEIGDPLTWELVDLAHVPGL